MIVKDFKGKKFIYTENGIEYPADKVLPSELYKYYAFNKNSADAFVNNYLFFSHPSNLNDIVDSTDLLLNFEDCSKENYDGIYKYRNDRFHFDLTKKPSYEEAKKDNFIDIRGFIYFSGFFNRGILSLTASPDNKLMMAHYTLEKGFILEFESTKLLNFLENQKENENVRIFPMNYSKTIKPINFFKESKKASKSENGKTSHSLNYTVPSLYIASIKDKVWHYEDEWRILIDRANMGHIAPPLDFREIPNENIIIDGRKIKYESDCLSKIILAPMFFNNSSFKAEIIDGNYKINYSLNIEFLQKYDLLDLMRGFLIKICSNEYNEKIFFQDLDFSNLEYERCLRKILYLNFSNDIISFSYGIKLKFENNSKV